MKYIKPLIVLLLFFLVSCKKDQVDGTNIKTFQQSINEMSSGLSTIEQIKLNEALYILKTFGVEGEDDVTELNALSKLLNGKKVADILSMANTVAQNNGLDWTSTGPPSLGDMNIFQSQEPEESDPNDVKAASISLLIKPTAVDSLTGPKALQVIPQLVDEFNQPIEFSNAALETKMEVLSNDVTLLTYKNLMQDNHFKGFNLKFSSLPSEKITDGVVDIQVTVKTTKKLLKMIRKGVKVNEIALKVQAPEPIETLVPEQPEGAIINEPMAPEQGGEHPKEDPKATVRRFLNHLGNQNLKSAYDASANPQWGSYEQFANPTSGFGAVKNIVVKDITTTSVKAPSAQVNATYSVTDKNGNQSDLQVTYTLKASENGWKITGYKINSSQKQ